MESQRLGERLGRCVYLVDAYQDYDQDAARGNYNPLRGARPPAPALLAERREALAGYVSDLRSKTQGRASFSMQFDSYNEVPANVAKEIIAKATGQ